MNGRSKAVVNEPLRSVAEVAEYCGVSISTVYSWNTRDRGPRRYRVGRYVRYRLSDVDAWLDQHSIGGVT